MLALLLAAAALPAGAKTLDPISYRQLTVLPIVQQSAADTPAAHYMTLEQGLSDHLVRIREHGDVNSVVVENRGAQPLLLVGGEMILGGQQDRILGQDTLIEPHKARTVGVYCVEHGRWSGAQQFGAAGGFVDSKVRSRAKVSHSQQQVWDEVARKAEATNAATLTGTYRAVTKKTEKAAKAYRDAIVPQLEALSAPVVGLAVAVNGRIVSVDAFATPELFAQYRDRILDAAAVGAQDAPADAAAPKVAPAAVNEFMQKAVSSGVKDGQGAAVYESALPAEQ
ncbi:MAG TPA: DUF6569 family protein [Myxococcales bacterium]|nr:DUF6569 family protein [Myxococcales bacterium]